MFEWSMTFWEKGTSIPPALELVPLLLSRGLTCLLMTCLTRMGSSSLGPDKGAEVVQYVL